MLDLWGTASCYTLSVISCVSSSTLLSIALSKRMYVCACVLVSPLGPVGI